MKKVIFYLVVLVTVFSIPIISLSDPFEVTFHWNNNYRIYGHQPVPQVNGFDYFFTPEQVNNDFNNYIINIESIEVSGYGKNLGAVINFDWEIYLSSNDINLPEGQFIQTLTDPVSGYTRNAETQYLFVIGSGYDSNNYSFSGSYDFISNQAGAYPYLSTIKDAFTTDMTLSSGLHAQMFLWTADNRNCHIEFSNLTLTIKGEATPIPQNALIDYNFIETTSTEHLKAPFTTYGGVTTSNKYSGLIKVKVWGLGVNIPSWDTEVDAFYASVFGGDWAPCPDVSVHGLNISFTGCSLGIECGAVSPYEYIVFINGVGYVPAGTRPEFSEDHTYYFVIDVGPEARFLTFGNGDGGVWDNSGEYYLEITGVSTVPKPADLDNDGDVDRDDLNILLSYRNQPASSCPECDIDGDGTITALDARKLVTLCTRPRCAIE